jgi:hypothetical protein
MKMQIVVFWDVMPWGLGDDYHCFGETYHPDFCFASILLLIKICL